MKNQAPGKYLIKSYHFDNNSWDGPGRYNINIELYPWPRGYEGERIADAGNGRWLRFNEHLKVHCEDGPAIIETNNSIARSFGDFVYALDGFLFTKQQFWLIQWRKYKDDPVMAAKIAAQMLGNKDS